MTTAHLHDLRRLYQSHRLIPFIGAGISMSIEWLDGGAVKRGPSWAELVERAAELLGFGNADLLRVRGTDLQILEYFKLVKHSHTQLTNWLLDHMRVPDDAIAASAIHTALASLENCSLYYTTNYDNLLERALTLATRDPRVVAVEADLASPARGCDVVKFHGDLEHPTKMVVSESDYEDRLSFSTAMDFRFRADLLGRAVLFLGYSFRDPNVAYLFRLINEGFRTLPESPSGRRAYIAVPDPSDFEIRLYRARNMEVIPISGRNITSDMENLLLEIASAT